ncbi:HEPN domain-containing protein [Vibrio crassostreae]|uniref:hypothetical protein n=1 Tax=Vibrio crassostreae TaxID=246167 RepID=UPI0005E1A965|nr:hypothetical protein [Vibrio crassostreae]CAK1711523.1 HEPN domain-containing protein [Vibrio crassostreae]CAK1759322.1 HEPN domain-containing protein [Vibrio crassostreae]CAK1790074.1 HEPN domain-containing protein [Vibrio crassostreae]CAK1809370.1 HEPN domain-containing protein [Vibrio crassostreae]CAK1897088.1 HEPN domain-containing protein [Vibrio crassostreae]
MKITIPMYVKGRSFIMAGGLVNAYGGDRFVYLHLLCQGIECITKAVLLNKSYKTYEPKLRNKFGHNLEKLYSEVEGNNKSLTLSKDAAFELKQLNSYYKNHMLRYGSEADFKEEAARLKVEHLHSEVLMWLKELNDVFTSIT